MTIVDESPETLRRARGIEPLVPRCSHRNEDNSTAWVEESRVGRAGVYTAFVCARCGAGAQDAEGLREAVRECVDDR